MFRFSFDCERMSEIICIGKFLKISLILRADIYSGTNFLIGEYDLNIFFCL